MRVRSGKKTGIVQIGQSPIVSARIIGRSFVSMIFEIGIDVSLCINERIQIATLDLFGRDVPSASTSIQDSNFYDGLNSSIVSDAREKTRITQIRNEQRISSVKIDITKFIANDEIRFQNSVNLKKISVVKMMGSDFEISNANEIIIEQPNGEQNYNVYDFCTSNILLGKDPAILKGSFPIADPEHFYVKNNFITSRRDLLDFRIVGPPGRYLQGFVYTRFSPCKFDIRLPLETIKKIPTIYCELTLTNNDGIITSIEKTSFNTSLIESDLELTQVSVNPNNRSIFARPIRSFSSPSQSPYTTLSQFSSLSEKTDNLYGRQGTRILREIYGRSHKLSIVTNKKTKIMKAEGLYGQNVIPFSIQKVKSGIKISANIVHKNIVAVGVQRRDASMRGKFYNLSSSGSEQLITNEGSIFEFYDYELKHDKIYEYRLYFVDNKGNIRVTDNVVSYHHFASSILEAAALTITDVKRSVVDGQGSTYPIISFSIDASLTEFGVETVKKFIEENGIDPSILGIAELESGSYKKMLVYQVDRQNLRTGEIETFGTSASSNFVDDSASPSSLRTISPMSMLENYSYTIRLGIRDASSVAPQQKATVTSPIGRHQFDFKPYKFKINAKRGILPSGQRMASTSAYSLEENFYLFSLGVEETVTVEAEDYFPSISGLSARRSLAGFNLLEWSVDGDVDYVDHFRVYASADGIEAYIGSAHPHITNGSYSYEDIEMFDRLGEVTYRVVPITLDFKESQGESSVTIIRENNLPTFLR